MVAGGMMLLVAAGLTGWDCASGGKWQRISTWALLEMICPAALTDERFFVPQSPVPHWYALFSKLSMLWAIGGGSFLAGLGLAVRNVRRNRPSPLQPAIAEPERPDEVAAPTFGRKPAMPVSTSTYTLSPERQALLVLETEVREAIGHGDVDGALALVDRAIGDCNDDQLTIAAQASQAADLDWPEIVAAAIEADEAAKRMGDEACRDVLLELGSVDEDRTSLYRSFFGPRPPQEVTWSVKHGQRMREGGPVRQTIAIVGMDQLAALESARGWATESTGRVINESEAERRTQVSTLAGTMFVLRYLAVVRRHAAETGFPFPVILHASVDRHGGEDAIRERGPALGLDLPCRVAPIEDEVTARIAERFVRHDALFRENMANSLRNFYEIFVTKGRVDSRFIPPSMPEYAHYRDLEHRLAVYEPENRVPLQEFNALIALVETVMKHEAPQAVDASPYH